jgi:hypothetical protein
VSNKRFAEITAKALYEASCGEDLQSPTWSALDPVARKTRIAEAENLVAYLLPSLRREVLRESLEKLRRDVRMHTHHPAGLKHAVFGLERAERILKKQLSELPIREPDA